MKALVFAQFRQYRILALVLGLLQFTLVFFSYGVQWLNDAMAGFHYIALIGNAVLGIVLGWLQFRGLTAKNRWAFFIHRPTSHWRLFGALTLSAAMIILVSTILPVFLAFTGLDYLTRGLLDARNFLLIPLIAGMAMCGWFGAAFIVLSPSKLAPLVLCLPALLLTPDAHGYWVFLTLLLVLVWLGFIACSAFKPCLESHVGKPFSAMMVTLPIQYALSFILTLLLGVTMQMNLILTDPTHNGSWNDYWKPGSFQRTKELFGPDLLDMGLRNSGMVPASKEELFHYDFFYPKWLKPAKRHQLLFMDHPVDSDGRLYHSDAYIYWYFSHSKMLFYGLDRKTVSFRGFLDNAGNIHQTEDTVRPEQRFTQIPKVSYESIMYIGNQAFDYDYRKGVFEKYLVLAEGEEFIGPSQRLRDGRAVIGSEHFYLFDQHNKELARIRLNVDVQNLESVRTAVVHDKIYVSVLSGKLLKTNLYQARHDFYEVNENGKVVMLSSQPLAKSWSDNYLYRHFIISPVMYYLHDILWLALEPYAKPSVTVTTILTQKIPAAVMGLALLMSIVSVAFAARLAKSSKLSKRRKTLWFICCGLVGIPGLISFYFLNHFHKIEPG